jgi:hypothetical protein
MVSLVVVRRQQQRLSENGATRVPNVVKRLLKRPTT